MRRTALGLPANLNLPTPWPPKMNEEYPDFEIIDQDGTQVKMSSLKGRTILIEYIDMMNPVSLSYNGAKEYGLYGKAPSYDEYVMGLNDTIKEETQGSFSLPNDKLVVVKLIIYNQDGTQPSAVDAENWANYYRFNKSDNYIVAVPVKDFRDEATDKIIPGFQLVDADFNLRVDSAGTAPKHNFKMSLVPHIPKLIR